jgi:hypothetical protein
MNTIWLKLAGAVVAILVAVVVIGQFTGGSSGPAPVAQKDKTFDDMVQRDKQLGQEPKPAEPAATQPRANAQPMATEPNAAARPAAQPAPATAAQPSRKYVLPSDIANKRTSIYVKPLNEEDDIAAQEQLPWATATRSMGRLPFLQYGPMVTTCRRILAQWPDSWDAFRAKQMLDEIHDSSKGEQYKVTEAELDIGKFLKPRPGWQERVVEPVR